MPLPRFARHGTRRPESGLTRVARLSWGVLATLALAACGGGGGAADTTAGGDTLSPGVTVSGGPDPATWLSCPTVAAATVGDSVNLSCERLIANLELQSQWVAVSTPVGVVVPAQGGLGLSFVASQAGDYLFEMQASAGGVATTRSLHLAVAPPPNKAPTLSCPTEVSVAVGQETLVACTVVDDGLPANATVTTQWAQTARPRCWHGGPLRAALERQ